MLGQKNDWKNQSKGKKKLPSNKAENPHKNGAGKMKPPVSYKRGSTGLAHLMGFANPPLASKLLEGAAKKVVL